jgi:hypothetical protein
MPQNKILIYVIVGLLSFGALSSIFSNVKDTFFPAEKTYSIEAVELMLKHDRLKQENKKLLIENEVIEKDNERLKHDIDTDSVTVANSSRQYRDSLRAELFR